MPAPRRRGAPGLRLARLPLLLAYLLVLLGTPVGEAGFRWMHLATAHSASPVTGGHVASPSAAVGDDVLAHTDAHDNPVAHEHAPRHDGGRADRHEHDHAHPHEPAAAPEDATAHPHAVTTEHHERTAIADREPEGGSVAPDQPHEHGGKIHTHRQHPAPDADLTAGALSKYYLSPPTTSAPAPAPAARHARHILPAPHAVTARIDTPPPRLPG